MSKKSKPVCVLRASAYVLDKHDNKCNLEDVVPKKDLPEAWGELHRMGEEVMNVAIGARTEDDIKFDMLWEKNNLLVITFYEDDFDFEELVSVFHEAAADTYLEGDANVYKDKYPIAFDDFIVDCVYDKKAKRRFFKNYWTWKKQPTKPKKTERVKTWDLYDAELDQDVDLSGDPDAIIPHAREVVTKNPMVWFDWTSPPTAIYSKNGFLVEDLVHAVQAIIVAEAKQRDGADFDPDRGIGTFSEISLNVDTNHVTLSKVMFD